jgi:hypothetical protein
MDARSWCPVSIQLAVFAMNLAADESAGDSQCSWHLQIVLGGRDRAACGRAGIEHAAFSYGRALPFPMCAVAADTEAEHQLRAVAGDRTLLHLHHWCAPPSQHRNVTLTVHSGAFWDQSRCPPASSAIDNRHYPLVYWLRPTRRCGTPGRDDGTARTQYPIGYPALPGSGLGPRC